MEVAQKERINLRMKENINKLSYHGIFTMAVVMGVMLCPVGTEYYLIACMLLWTAFHNITVIRGRGSARRQYHKMDLAVLLFMGYEILDMVYRMIRADEETGIDLTWNILFMALCLLYFMRSETQNFHGMYLDGIVYSGLLVMGMVLYYDICGTAVPFLLEELLAEPSKLASYLLLVSMVSVLQYCRCRSVAQQWCYGASAGIGFFLLLVNHNRVSLWLMLLFFLLVPVCVRPTAELIRRDMQMCALYALLLCNMSLLCNYMDIFLVEVSYDLEQSVYLELVLAVGALVFFHYWDRLPQEISRERIVMCRLYRVYRLTAAILMCLFLWLLLGGGEGASLTGHAGGSFLQNLAVPLREEVGQGNSFLHVCTEEQGLVTLAACFLFAGSILFRMRRRIGWDKPLTGGLYLISLFGIFQCFLWNVSWSVLTIYLILAVAAANCEEERSRFAGVRRWRDMTKYEEKGRNWA